MSTSAASPTPSPVHDDATYLSWMVSWWQQTRATVAPALTLTLASTGLTASEAVLIGVIAFLVLLVLLLGYIIHRKNRLLAHLHLGSARYKTLAEYARR